MSGAATFDYKRAFVTFIAILLLFFGIVVSVIIAHEKEMLAEARRNALRELGLIGHFARDAVLRDDFASVEEFIRNWGEEHPEVLELKAVAPNGFILVHFRRAEQLDRRFQFNIEVKYAGKEILALEMIRDLSSVEKSLHGFIVWLISGSVFLIVVLGGALWSTLRRYALLPLERELAIRREGEKKFSMLIESAPDAMVYVNGEGRIVFVNGQAEKLFGYSRLELEGKEVELVIPERFRERHRGQFSAYLDKPVVRPIGKGLNLYGLSKDGREFPVDISLSPIETRDGLFIMAAIRDISERKRAEDEIRRGYYFQTTINSILHISLENLSLEEQMDRILGTILQLPFLSEQSMGCIYLVEDEPEVLVMKVQRGMPPAIQASCSTVPFGTCLCGMSASTREIIFEESGTHGRRFEGMPEHGHYCVPIMSGEKVLGALNLYVEKSHVRSREEEELLTSVARTIAGIIERRKAEQERERLREQLVQAEKLSALGRLTANVAHEIRNPLTSIGGYARRFEKELPLDTKGREFAGIIISETARLENILRNVLTFSRETGLNLRPEDVNPIIEEALVYFEPIFIERRIRVERLLGSVPRTMMDRERIQEVLRNLLSNAADSMPGGGLLTVVSREETVHETPYISVGIKDTGAGIPEDKRRMIFEPFFTTKALGQGTGLGLAICKKIIEDHGGFIKVESRLGERATVTFYLPLTPKAPPADRNRSQ